MNDNQIVTLTMARLYKQQRCFDKALEIYQILLDREPGNVIIQEELKELLGKTGEKQVKKGELLKELLAKTQSRKRGE